MKVRSPPPSSSSPSTCRRSTRLNLADGILYTFAPPANGRPGRLTLSGLEPPAWSDVRFDR